MEWPRIDGHTPGPFRVMEDSGGMVWTEGDPYGHGQMHFADARGWGHLTGVGACALSGEKGSAIHDANAELIAIIGPHLCDIPDCPGPKLVAQLEAGAAMRQIIEQSHHVGEHVRAGCQICLAALAWDSARSEKEE